MKFKIYLITNAVLVLLLISACSALKPKPSPTQPAPTQVMLPTTGVNYYFVTDKLLVPTTQEQAKAFALNVDEDAQESPDNLFGKFLSLLTTAAPSLDMQLTLDQAVNDGQLVLLHAVKTNDVLNDPSASWIILQGQQKQPKPNFDNNDKFSLDSSAPLNLPIVGSLTNGHFTGGPGAARVQIFLLGQLVKVDLIGVRLEAEFSADGCVNGKIGGGITDEEFHSSLLPAIADGLNQVITADKALTNTLLNAFDTDNDGTITLQELENNPVLMIAFSPDLDLLDASGNFNPGQDGVKDSYSMGLGFTCVPAVFILPGE